MRTEKQMSIFHWKYQYVFCVHVADFFFLWYFCISIFSDFMSTQSFKLIQYACDQQGNLYTGEKKKKKWKEGKKIKQYILIIVLVLTIPGKFRQY